MASLFWVGGTGTWNGTVGTKWASTSGGAGGQPIPTSIDDVFFDANSTGTVTIAAGNTGAKSITCTGFTGTLTGSQSIQIFGSLLLVVGMTYTCTGTISFMDTGTITSAGKSLPAILINAVGAVVTAADSITMLGLNITRGKFDAAGFNHSILSFVGNSGFVKELDISNTTLTIRGTGTIWATNNTTFTFTTTNSTVKINTGTGSNARTFTSGGLNFNNIWFTGANSGIITISSSATYADFKDDITVAHTLIFTAATTTTVTTFSVSGGVGRMITMQSSSGGSAWNLVDTSGTNTADYVSLQDSAASGGATFNATNAVNVSGNSGWNFTAKQDSMFLMFM